MCKNCRRIQKKIYHATEHFKELRKKQAKRHYQRHKDEINKRHAEHYANHSDDWTRRFKEAYYANKDKFRERVKIDRNRFPGRHRSCVAKYRACKLNATPAWADLDKIQWFYNYAIWLSQITGVPHEVDHIIPLQGENVCGLHVENNLQVIPMRDNRIKGNKLEVSF